MSLLQTSHTAANVKISLVPRCPWWRSAALGALLLLALTMYPFLYSTAPPYNYADNFPFTPFLRVWMLSFLPYLAACALVLATKPAPGRWRWIELGIILAGAFVLRALLLPLPPGLSRDSWRYLWDARVTLHGFSPYVYAPFNPALKPLADTVLLPNMRFRTVPTIYPPGAQVVFLLSYLLAASNLFFLKGIFLLFDMITCGSLVVLLKRRRLDPARALIYAWCPLPIVEFAIQGHVDVITLTFSILALLSASNSSIRGRVLTGFLVGMAALTKIYPILLLVVIMPGMLLDANERGKPFYRSIRGRDYAMLAVCFLTILLGYLPYYIMGHGQVLGFLRDYANAQGENAGIIQQFMHWLSYVFRWSFPQAVQIEQIVSLICIASISLLVFFLLLRKRMGMEMAVLILFGSILAVSTHVFPWYNPILLLWIPVLIEPIWAGRRLPGKELAITTVWYFTCISIVGYFINSGGQNYIPGWTPYYLIAYVPLVLGLGIAAISGVISMLNLQKGKQDAIHL